MEQLRKFKGDYIINTVFGEIELKQFTIITKQSEKIIITLCKFSVYKITLMC